MDPFAAIGIALLQSEMSRQEQKRQALLDADMLEYRPLLNFDPGQRRIPSSTEGLEKLIGVGGGLYKHKLDQERLQFEREMQNRMLDIMERSQMQGVPAQTLPAQYTPSSHEQIVANTRLGMPTWLALEG